MTSRGFDHQLHELTRIKGEIISEIREIRGCFWICVYASTQYPGGDTTRKYHGYV
jgi:hypothetical protein